MKTLGKIVAAFALGYLTGAAVAGIRLLGIRSGFETVTEDNADTTVASIRRRADSKAIADLVAELEETGEVVRRRGR